MALTSGALSCVPDDVLCEVFVALANADPPRRAAPYIWGSDASSLGWIKLTHVCRRLRLLGLDLPNLWASIICVFPKACQTFLARSQNVPLTLNIRPQLDLDFFELLPIFDLIPRARHITDRLSYGDPLTRTSWWTLSPLDRLEYLKLSTGSWPGSSGDMGHLVAPALRAYTVVGMFIPFTAPTLRSLDLRHSMTWMELLNILRSCPLLTSLQINKVLDADSPASSTTTSTVYLPHLEGFCVHGIDDHGTYELLDHLIFPRSVDFEAGFLDHDPSLLHALVAHLHLQHTARDTLTITTSTPTDNEEGIFNFALTEGCDRRPCEYGTHPEGGLQFETLLDEEDDLTFTNVLSHLLTSTAQSIYILALHAGLLFGKVKTFKDNWRDPLAVSEEGFASLWRSMRALENVKTVYFSDLTERSISLLKPHLGWISSASQDVLSVAMMPETKSCMAFPDLAVIVVDSRCQRIHVEEWNSLLEVIEARHAGGRPIKQVVLMGSNLCHVIIGEGTKRRAVSDGYLEIRTEIPMQDLPLDALRSIVQVVDLRNEGCRCSKLNAPKRALLAADLGESDSGGE